MNILLQPGKIYHIYNHSVGEANLFRNDKNFDYFLKKYAQYIFPICKTYAYCLMPNHFHIMIRVNEEEELDTYYHQLQKIKEENNQLKSKPSKPKTTNIIDYPDFVMQQFQNMFNGYAQAYNKMYNRKGALFLDFVRRKEISHEKYFSHLVYYIHNNPVHHKFCKNIEDWKYSSYHAIVGDKYTKIDKEEILKWFGSIDWFKEFHETKYDSVIFKDFDF
ncbi:MAG: hypothetical protein SFY32_09055 [Bacteroidota bacterium]|nr:hypothetical protein [Bacteroidota bacterium]